jgi:hypothetical protein
MKTAAWLALFLISLFFGVSTVVHNIEYKLLTGRMSVDAFGVGMGVASLGLAAWLWRRKL